MKINCSNSGLEHKSNILNLIGIILSPTIKTEDFNERSNFPKKEIRYSVPKIPLWE